eukprot:6197724-Pleurochrysis_carterae.AAC.1
MCWGLSAEEASAVHGTERRPGRHEGSCRFLVWRWGTSCAGERTAGSSSESLGRRERRRPDAQERSSGTTVNKGGDNGDV